MLYTVGIICKLQNKAPTYLTLVGGDSPGNSNFLISVTLGTEFPH